MMKQIAVGAVAGTMLLSAGGAFAADATGTIRTWNEQNRQLTLDNGQTYMLNTSVPITGVQLSPGQRVTLTFDVNGNQNMVSRIVPAAGGATGATGATGAGGAGATPGAAPGGAGAGGAGPAGGNVGGGAGGAGGVGGGAGGAGAGGAGGGGM